MKENRVYGKQKVPPVNRRITAVDYYCDLVFLLKWYVELYAFVLKKSLFFWKIP